MPSTIITKNGSGAPLAADLVAGELAVDLTNGRLYTENTGGSVIEIGLNPSGNLDVTGTVTADGLTVDGLTQLNTNNLANGLTISGNDNANVKIRFDNTGTGGGDFVIQGGIAGASNEGLSIRDLDNSAQRIHISSGGDISFYEDTGTTAKFFWDASAESLGIGTSSPSALGLQVTRGTGVAAGVLFSNAANNWQIATGTTTNYIAFVDNQFDERMRIESDGNVAIGHTSANSSRLHLRGAGSAGTPQLMITDSLSGKQSEIRQDTSGNLVFDHWTGASRSERMRIDSSGNVGIGTGSPYGLTHWQDSSTVNLIATNSGADGQTDTTVLSLIGQARSYGNNIAKLASIDFKTDATSWFTGNITFNVANSDGTNPALTPLEAMRIDSSGNLLVGTSSQLSSGGFGNHEIRASNGNAGAAALVVYNSNAADSATAFNAIKNSATTTSSQRFIQFYANAGATAMGGIVGNGASNAQFATISDAREKTNIQSISGSLTKINALRPVEFDWIASGEHVNAGFVAQEVEKVFPEFVVENMAEEGAEERKGLTGGMTGGIVAHLVKAIQEQQDLIESLTARIATLEGAN